MQINPVTQTTLNAPSQEPVSPSNEAKGSTAGTIAELIKILKDVSTEMAMLSNEFSAQHIQSTGANFNLRINHLQQALEDFNDKITGELRVNAAKTTLGLCSSFKNSKAGMVKDENVSHLGTSDSPMTAERLRTTNPQAYEEISQNLAMSRKQTNGLNADILKSVIETGNVLNNAEFERAKNENDKFKATIDSKSEFDSGLAKHADSFKQQAHKLNQLIVQIQKATSGTNR